MTDMSIDDINQRLQALAAEKTELERVVAEKLKTGKRDFIAALRDSIVSAGYDLAEIAEALTGPVKRKNGGNGVVYACPEDPTLRYAGKGKTPEWLRERMRANGFDPSDPGQRRQYVAVYMAKLDS